MTSLSDSLSDIIAPLDIMTPQQEQQAMQEEVRYAARRRQAYQDWWAQASPEDRKAGNYDPSISPGSYDRSMPPGTAEGDIMPPTARQQLMLDALGQEHEAVGGQPQREDPLFNALQYGGGEQRIGASMQEQQAMQNYIRQQLRAR